MLIDIHAHVDSNEFFQDIGNVISRCNIIIVNAGVDYESDLRTLELSTKFSNVFPAIGLHPEFVEKVNELENVIPLVDRAVAISEVGLDYYWVKDEEARRRQINILNIFLEIGEKKNKPLIVHIRGGIKDFLDMIGSFNVKFVMHAFEGSIKNALKIEDLGGYISIPPIIVRDKYRQQIVKQININNLLTETDSPFLPPRKGERNEPCNVKYSIEKIAEIKAIPLVEVEKYIENNFKKLINL
ncbi:hydrolase TatD [Candidatus Acidianus copahuensis]|uniref:Hydrolase TatD n=1 Tax=Candidatus Acidianus copahuensis TaxID=1160895 RepID=A0A031LNT1_9CREN|nr:TatD family hydrolase [Candidatus Acidianus copahuensis]EZQ03219.1 hydrolase TatD [Candidatus Acidianus copahuensis]